MGILNSLGAGGLALLFLAASILIPLGVRIAGAKRAERRLQQAINKIMIGRPYG